MTNCIYKGIEESKKVECLHRGITPQVIPSRGCHSGCIYYQTDPSLMQHQFLRASNEKLFLPEQAPHLEVPTEDDVEVALGEEDKYFGLGSTLETAFSALGIRSCEACKKRKRKINRTQKKLIDRLFRGKKHDAHLQFIWCYFHRAAKQDEIRWSMRSVQKNFQGQASFLVIGDRPPWYSGPFIDCPRIRRGRGFRRGLHDVLHKMGRLSEHPDVEDEFVWMMDDVFMLKPTTIYEIMMPRAGREIRPNRGNGWQSVKTDTANRLKEEGFPAMDYATHLPHFVQKKKLQVLFELWNPYQETFLWEVAYHNIHRHKPIKHDPFLRRVKREQSVEWYDRISTTSHFLNIYNNGWGGHLRNWLMQTFPKPHADEEGILYPYLPLETTPKLDDHYLLIQSSYNEEELSRNRLDVTRRWLIPSLQGQTRKVRVQVALCKEDPLLEERMQLFQDCGHEVEFIYRPSHEVPLHHDNVAGVDPWEIPTGIRTAVSRIDDDDAIPNDFLELTQMRAEQSCPWDKALLEWPQGYVWINGTLYRSNRPGNQFCTVVSNEGLHPHIELHWKLPNTLPTLIVNQSRGWVWVRHSLNVAETRNQHVGKKASPPNMGRWSIPLSE